MKSGERPANLRLALSEVDQASMWPDGIHVPLKVTGGRDAIDRMRVVSTLLLTRDDAELLAAQLARILDQGRTLNEIDRHICRYGPGPG